MVITVLGSPDKRCLSRLENNLKQSTHQQQARKFSEAASASLQQHCYIVLSGVPEEHSNYARGRKGWR